jgi:carboxyl-terminal processing protease
MNKRILIFVITILNLNYVYSQKSDINHSQIKEDLYQILNDISQYYAYKKDKNVDLNCLLEYYENQISNIKTEEESVLFFEYLLDEFYDSHMMLNTNRNSSYRLHSQIYATIENRRPIISNVWQTQIENLEQDIVGAELLKINGNEIEKEIDQFPTHCNDKSSNRVQEWIVNKVIAGRRNESRILTLKLVNNDTIEFDLDKLKLKQSSDLLTSSIENNIGIIRFNNSLGNNSLIKELDKALEKLMNTKGLIFDLRNTVGGGNSYVARGIMGRFIEKTQPYQKHQLFEKHDGNEVVERSWIEYVSPRGKTYQKPVAILVGRWTGSMGEGLAIGFEGMDRANIIGSEMERLAGEMNEFSFKHRNYNYRLSVAKLYHVNGTPREEYIPTNYVEQTTTVKDETLEKGIELINKMTE